MSTTKWEQGQKHKSQLSGPNGAHGPEGLTDKEMTKYTEDVQTPQSWGIEFSLKKS